MWYSVYYEIMEEGKKVQYLRQVQWYSLRAFMDKVVDMSGIVRRVQGGSV
jgi:hypothetical protein